ncbi:colicin-like bacteriocin tRNase domain-containing protein [Yersinia intermedia]|uniref:Colicin transporter n=1 Tax=Yersinia intermedia TaxID=631 RepID=A0ABX6F2B2_YERIN|nr:colicin-like bacteriocin tRNase domain-containing protein [Yersinia intermedia]QGR68161.1 colicin transporter [Yersinia intermedia]QGR69164.1 colicin transporter [Yersinia intermedia]CRY83679.1 colicin/pyocin immunity family protein [Yersinia intermedia]
MGKGHSNIMGHGRHGPTGGRNPNSGRGWGVSQTPYGPLRHYSPSLFDGNDNLAQRPELQVAIVPGVAVPLSLVAGEWGFTLLKPKVVAAALDLALTRMAMFAVDAAPYAGRFAGVVGMLLAPSEIAKDDMSVIRRTVVTLPADKITTMPLAQLPTQPAVVADVRLHDVVQDGVQKIAIVKSKHVPIAVPVVQAKPTDRTGVFTAQILNGMPPIHIHVDTSSSPPTAMQPSGISEVRDSPVTPVFSPLGSHSHDAIVYFPVETNTDPVYISVTTVLTPEQITQVEAENRQKQAQWDANYPVEAAEYQLSQANDALAQEQNNIVPYQAALDELKGTWEGRLLDDPDRYPFRDEIEEFISISSSSRYRFMFDIEIKNRQELENLLNIGGEAFDPFPDGMSPEEMEYYGYHAGLLMQALTIGHYDLLRKHLLAYQANINTAQLALDSIQHQLDMAINAVNNAEQHLTQVRANVENVSLTAETAEWLRPAEFEQWNAEVTERWRLKDEQRAIEIAEWQQRVERERLAAQAADGFAKQQIAIRNNSFSLPAHPKGSTHTPGFAGVGMGTIALSSPVARGFSATLRTALARFSTIAPTLLARPIAMTVGSGFYPTKVGGPDKPALVGSFPLSEMGLPPATPLPQQGEIDLPVRMLMTGQDDWTDVYAVKTGAANIAAKVKVTTAQFDQSKGVYTFTTDSQPPRTFIFTPAQPPGMDISSVLPQPPSAPVVPSHTGADITFLATKPSLIFLALEEGDFHDYIIWFPAASGLEPVYIYLKTPRDEPGEVTGRGQQVAGVWLAEAGKGLGAPIPVQIADKLRGRKFSSFGEFRRALWLEISKDPTLSEQFKSGNLGNIKNGKAPSPRESEQVGGRVKHELHHVKPISKGGAVYDIDNIRVLTPKRHIKIHKEVK